MVKSKEELLASIKERLGEDSSDEAIALVEDITDTYDDMATRVTEAGDWKSRYEENDALWRQKYRDRFFNVPDGVDYQQEDEAEYEETETPKTFDELFTTM